ncbi:hypothetical protein N8015_06295, partial [Planktomarina temperata]|nr:hypothetical protein [Planktomarina temperata]
AGLQGTYRYHPRCDLRVVLEWVSSGGMLLWIINKNNINTKGPKGPSNPLHIGDPYGDPKEGHNSRKPEGFCKTPPMLITNTQLSHEDYFGKQDDRKE